MGAPQPDRDLNAFELAREFGEQQENEFAKLLFRPDVEVKADKQAAVTGNVFIEFAQGKNTSKAAGIATTRAHWQVLVLVGLDTCVVVKTARLLALARQAVHEGRVRNGGDNGNVGALVPVEWLVRPFK